jgi:hypothetical protein
LVGLQRRYDDENRRRAVKRATPVPFMKATNVFIAIDQNEDILRVLETYSATISRKSVTSRTKVVVSSVADAPSFKIDIEKAQEEDIPIVTEDWIVACVAAGDLEDPKDEQYAVFKKKKEKPPEKKIEVVKKIEEPPPKKKRKVF